MISDLDVALAAARRGAAVVAEGFGAPLRTEYKGATDPVTEVDLAAEETILAEIRAARPDDSVLAEESGGGGWQEERVWIVDPLDGTVNFVHRLPHVSVSVALWANGIPQTGAVIDPLRGEEYWAQRGTGAFCNGQRLEVSERRDLGEALVVTGFPYDRRDKASAYEKTLGAVLGAVEGIRRLGSAALDFAWLSAGRYDGYWEYGLGPWDAAAGLLLVEEAGGKVTSRSGERYPLDSSGMVATNGHLHEQLRKLVDHHWPPHLR